MVFFWRHKFFTLLLLTGVWYWFYNPSQRFGIDRKEVTVYNRIPVIGFDLYVDTKKEMFLLADLHDAKNVRYWFDNYSPSKNNNTVPAILYVGTGRNKNTFTLPDSMGEAIKSTNFSIRQLPTPEAIERYNADCDSNKACAILVHLK